MKPFTGQCLCGECRFAIFSDCPKGVFICHCSRCRKETGSAFAATAFFDDARLDWIYGEDSIRNFQLPNTRKQRAFCDVCGSPLPRIESSGVVLPLGALVDSEAVTPSAHIFYKDRALWEDSLNNICRYEALPVMDS